jgi:hypothetical protein
MEANYMSTNRQKFKTRQVRIDYAFYISLKMEAAKRGETIKYILQEKAGWAKHGLKK